MAVRDSMASPLARARGLGSAKAGAEHWIAQRIGSAALVPLTLWFVISALGFLGAERAEVVAWLREPVPAILMIALVAATFHHVNLGVQVVIEDYIHREGTKIAALAALRFACVLLALAGVFAVLRVAFGG